MLCTEAHADVAGMEGTRVHSSGVIVASYHFFPRSHPSPAHRPYLKVETVLLNLLLWPGVEVQRGAAGVGHEAAMGEHHRWGEHRRGGGGPHRAATDGLHLRGGRQGLLLCHESATGKKIQCENPTLAWLPDAAGIRATGLVQLCQIPHESPSPTKHS